MGAGGDVGRGLGTPLWYMWEPVRYRHPTNLRDALLETEGLFNTVSYFDVQNKVFGDLVCNTVSLYYNFYSDYC